MDFNRCQRYLVLMHDGLVPELIPIGQASFINDAIKRLLRDENYDEDDDHFFLLIVDGGKAKVETFPDEYVDRLRHEAWGLEYVEETK